MKYEKDPDGRWHRYFDQQKGESCGPTCVRILVNAIKGRDVGEGPARRAVEIGEGQAVLTTFASESGGAGAMGSHDWGAHGGKGSGGATATSSGSNMAPLRAACHSFGLVDASIPVVSSWAALSRTSLSNPGIAGVDWNGDIASFGGHWVVAAGALANGDILAIDPIYGIGFFFQTDAGQVCYQDVPNTVWGLVPAGDVLVTA